MMRAVVEVTRPLGIPTTVSLNPVMVDGTGMCGGCRVSVGGEQKFVCVDGPEFNGHQVDFEELGARLRAYREQEGEALRLYDQGAACRSQVS
jgi:ferredoxin--NADP+ reductase